jgi:type VI protein secretion system component VasK
MTLTDVLETVAGPFGALALAVIALVWVVRTWRAEVQRLRAEHLTELEASRAECTRLSEARIADAKLNTEALQAVNDRMHDAIQKLWQMWRASQGKTVPPPT